MLSDNKTKICTTCHIEKNIDKFRLRHRVGRKLPYHDAECKECKLKRDRDYYARNREKIKLYSLEYRVKNGELLSARDKIKYQKRKERVHEKALWNRQNNPQHYIFMSAKRRAKNNNLEFNLTEKDIFIPEICPVLGIPLKFNFGGIKTYACDNSPSLDRIDNNKGYIKGNIKVISWRANNLKRDGTLEEFIKLIEYIKRESTP